MLKNRSAIFDSNFVYFLIIGLFITIRIISSTFVIDDVLGYILNMVIQLGLMLSLPLFLFSYLRKQKLKTTLDQYGFHSISLKAIFLSFLIGILVYIITIFVASFFSFIISLLGYESTSSGATVSSYPLWLLFVELFMTAVLPGFCEEVAHRGMLLNTYKNYGVKKAILLSGLFFGLMHLNINQFFYATLIGFFFGAIAFMTDSIYPTMIMHFTNNAISTIMGYSSANNLPLSNIFNSFFESIVGNGAFLGILLLFVTMAITFSLLVFLSALLIKETRIRRLAMYAQSQLKRQLRQNIMGNIIKDEQQQIDTNIVITKQNQGEGYIIDFKTIKLPPPVTYANKLQPQDKIFMYANLTMGILITIFTFIWGIL